MVSDSSGNRSSNRSPSCLYPIFVAYHLDSGTAQRCSHGRFMMAFVRKLTPMAVGWPAVGVSQKGRLNVAERGKLYLLSFVRAIVVVWVALRSEVEDRSLRSG